MKLYIPSVGDELRLTADWNFQFYNEYRNATLMEFIGDTRNQAYGASDNSWAAMPCTIPAGQVLKIDRIYIRKGKDDFDSVTFLWKGQRTASRTETRQGRRAISSTLEPMTLGSLLSGRRATPVYEDFTYVNKIPAKPVRFWVKLKDANNIEFEPA